MIASLHYAALLMIGLIGSSVARSASTMALEKLMDVLWATEECENFVSDPDWVIVDKSDCNAEKCDYPRAMCVENAEVVFSDKGRQRRCRPVPEDCARAVYSQANDILGPAAAASASVSASETMIEHLIGSELINVCSQPRDMGTNGDGCQRSYQYYYDIRRGHCTRMIFWGCGGNENHFETLEDCLFKCAGRVYKSNDAQNAEDSQAEVDVGRRYRPPRCRKEKRTGNQRCKEAGLQQKFYFDQRVGDCNMFFWRGCAGNSNQFDTMEECRAVCRV